MSEVRWWKENSNYFIYKETEHWLLAACPMNKDSDPVDDPINTDVARAHLRLFKLPEAITVLGNIVLTPASKSGLTSSDNARIEQKLDEMLEAARKDGLIPE